MIPNYPALVLAFVLSNIHITLQQSPVADWKVVSINCRVYNVFHPNPHLWSDSLVVRNLPRECVVYSDIHCFLQDVVSYPIARQYLVSLCEVRMIRLSFAA